MSGTYNRACKVQTLNKNLVDKEFKQIKKRIHEILTKLSSKEEIITKEEKDILKRYKDLVKLVQLQRKNQNLRKQRQLEIEDDYQLIKLKCKKFIELIQSSKYIVIYTGAGISTSASIPDYRGPNGVWTMIKNGQNVPMVNDLVYCKPTYTHMAIKKLVDMNIVKYVVSQNCDGLHLRSGLTREYLSEIHGNIFIEICQNCKQSYLRSFDVTERTSFRKHETGRKCYYCSNGQLIDTIVHFGEKGKLTYPLQWEQAINAAQNADLIICLGSSLKILRQYHCLWPKLKNLIIINLQWTPKDSQSILKINGKCDQIMMELMNGLNIHVDQYEKQNDFIYKNFIPIKPYEQYISCNRIGLDQLINGDVNIKQEDLNNQDKTKIKPAWFGKGLRRR